MESLKLKYEFTEPDEATKMIKDWRNSYGSSCLPEFEIDRVEVDPIYGEELTLYLRIKR